MHGLNRKLALLLALSITLLGLAGCGGASATKTSPQAKPASGRQIELNVLAFPGTSIEALGDVNNEFEKKNPGVRVRIKDAQGLQLLGQGGSAPNPNALDGIDVIFAPSQLLGGLATGKLIRDLSAIKVPGLNDLVVRLYDDLGQVEGKRYGLPISVAPAMMLLSEQELSRAGIKMPAPEWTWQDFENILATAKQAGITTIAQLTALLDPAVRSYGGLIYDADRRAWAFDSPQAKQALAMLGGLTSKELVQAQAGGQGGIMLTRSAGPAQSGPGVKGQGMPALLAVGGGGGAVVINAPGLAQVPYPRGPKGSFAPASATAAAVVASSTNPEMATEYAKFAITPAAQTFFAKGGLRPVVADAKALTAWQEKVGDRMARATEAGLQGAYVSQAPSFNELIAGLNPFFTGKAQLDATVADLIKKLTP